MRTQPRLGCSLLAGYTADYVRWGDGPPLVLIPGLAGGAALLGPLAAELAAHFRVLCYELRGEQDCFELRRGFGFGDLVNDLGEFLDEQGLENPILLGVSFGGMVALRFAAAHPGRLSGLVVQGADVRFQRSLLRQVAGQVLRQYPLPTNSPFVNQFFNLLFGGRQHNEALVEFVTRLCWRTDQSVMAHRFRLVEQLDLAPDLERVCVPALILSGEKDVLVSPDGVAGLADGIQGARLVKLPRAGHLAFTTHATEMARQVFVFAEETGLLHELATTPALR